MTERKANTAKLLPLLNYDRIIVSFSGGKDSIACVLFLLGLGLRDQMELWHQDVDGRDKPFMDWPCTESYCKAFASAFDLPILFQWRHGGFRREMLKKNEQSQPISFEDLDGSVTTLDSSRSKVATRRLFPQVSGDLRVRWCSSSLKIDVCTKAINNTPRLKTATVLLVTGERGEESPQRAKYSTVEAHKSNTKSRAVHQYRPIQDWSEAQVWDMMREHGVNPHPAYHLGFGRVSCAACIFGNNDQWATVRALMPVTFDEIATHEEDFGKTIHRTLPVVERADKGTPYSYQEEHARLAMSTSYPQERVLVPVSEWVQPAGAYTRCGGPS